METQRILMRSLAVVFIASVIWTITDADQKSWTCCTKVSTAKLTDRIISFRIQKESPSCVKAVIFETERGDFCLDSRQSWVKKKVKRLVRAQRKHLTSTPPPSSSSSLSEHTRVGGSTDSTESSSIIKSKSYLCMRVHDIEGRPLVESEWKVMKWIHDTDSAVLTDTALSEFYTVCHFLHAGALFLKCYSSMDPYKLIQIIVLNDHNIVHDIGGRPLVASEWKVMEWIHDTDSAVLTDTALSEFYTVRHFLHPGALFLKCYSSMDQYKLKKHMLKYSYE